MNRSTILNVFFLLFLTSTLTLSGCGSDATGEITAQEFELTIENISDQYSFETPFAPGVWAVHRKDGHFFLDASNQRLEGLESLAEDGDPSKFADVISQDAQVSSSGVFNTVVGASEAGPLFAGDRFQVRFSASPDDGKLAIASMLGQSNDYFVSNGDSGVELFDQYGRAIQFSDISDRFWIYDAGTEADEAPGQGLYQAPRQAEANSGPAEGVVHAFVHSTRALPLASAIVSVGVSGNADEGYSIKVNNISDSQGVFVTPIAPVFWAVHDGTWSFFSRGQAASSALESLAEDGSPAALVDLATSSSSVGSSGAVAVPEGENSAGPLFPGQSYRFHIDSSENYSNLSLAAMVGQTNDVFIAPIDSIRLRDENGNGRSADSIADEINRRLVLFDAGTEVNEVPGVGVNQAPRQAAANQGEDENGVVSIYSGITNDLAGEDAGGFLNVSVSLEGQDSLRIRISNTSDQTRFPGLLTPFVAILHDGNHRLFREGQAASAELEKLAEDGDASSLLTSLSTRGGVHAELIAIPQGKMEAGPLHATESYEQVLDVSNVSTLNLVAMLVPSNDTFVSLGEVGVNLRNSSGSLRSISAIQSDIQSQLSVWDAGSEANQASASGADQAPYQGMAGDGIGEGDGTVRSADANLWPLPDVSDLLRITIRAIN